MGFNIFMIFFSIAFTLMILNIYLIKILIASLNIIVSINFIIFGNLSSLNRLS